MRDRIRTVTQLVLVREMGAERGGAAGLHHGDDEVGEPGRVPTPERNTIMLFLIMKQHAGHTTYIYIYIYIIIYTYTSTSTYMERLAIARNPTRPSRGLRLSSKTEKGIRPRW